MDCLVNILKVNTNDNSIPKIDDIIVHVNKGYSSEENLSFSSKTIDETMPNISVPDGHTFNTKDNKFVLSEGDYDFFINRKQEIKSLYLGSAFVIDVFSMSDMDNLVAVQSKIKGDISYLEGSVSKLEKFITYVGDNSTELQGDSSVFSNCSKLVSIKIPNANIYGDISNFGKSVNLDSFIANNTKITGTVESLVAKLVENGKTTGTIKEFSVSNTNVTYKGNAIQGTKIVTWNGVDNITIK